jgi:3-oxoacyl-[acyl-carrier protein] reductase
MDQVRPSDTTTARRGADPVQRWGSDDEVGDFIAYLCTDAASWIQGQSINQDGGLVMEH